MTVERKAAPTEIPPVTANTIIGMEGGIISARTEEQATSAVAWPGGYPFAHHARDHDRADGGDGGG